MTKANTTQLLPPEFLTYYRNRIAELETQLDQAIKLTNQVSDRVSLGQGAKLARQSLTARIAELETARQTMEAVEIAKRQNDLDNFEADLAGETENRPTARENISTQYSVTRDGRIASPGKFESEMIYVPYYWNWILEGEGEDMDDRDGTTWTVLEITQEDRQHFPEIHRNEHAIALREDCQGFIHAIESSTPHFAELGTEEDRAEQAEQQDDTPSIETQGTIMDPRL